MSRNGPFIVGANLPWIAYGCDFGANQWQPGGGLAARPEVRARARVLLASLADAGADVVRWFVLADGRAGLRLDARGRLIGVDGRFFADFDAAVGLLHETGLRAVFVLLDFRWFSAPAVVDRVQTGGRRELMAGRAARHRLLETVIAPVLDQYGEDPSILAWDLINEPEWATTSRPFRRRGRLSTRQMRAYIRDATALVHARSRQMATVGLASAASLPLVAGLGLDFHQVHWYDHLPPRFHPARPVRSFADDRPVLLGEFPTRGSVEAPAAILHAARASGYLGALAWSVVRRDEASDRDVLVAAIRSTMC